MNWKTIIRGSVSAVAIFLAQATVANAQLPVVPEQLDADIRTAMQARRDKLVKEEGQIRASAVGHNQKCGSVALESALANACRAAQDSLKTAARRLADQKAEFTKTIDALKRLVEEESVLSKAIRTGIEQMRTMVDDTSASSGDQLQRLNEQLKKYIEERRQFRVRKVAACACVRG